MTQTDNPILNYYELTKPRLNAMVLLSTAVGFILAVRGEINYVLLVHTLVATALVSAGSLAMNQWQERRIDSLMKRTARRPLPANKVCQKKAVLFGLMISVAGLVYLTGAVNVLASMLALATFTSYIFIYTPLKQETPHCTVVGAIPGALPPLIGWAAAEGRISGPALSLFLVLFFWQMPHFFSLSWMYRHDYENAGLKMWSVVDPSGKEVSRQIVLYSFGLFCASLLPYFMGLAGMIYLIGAGTASALYLAAAIYGYNRLETMARPLFKGSLLYLLFVLTLMMADRV